MRCSHMFAFGSMLLSAISGLKRPENWSCFEQTNACHMVTDDMDVVEKSGNDLSKCRYDQVQLSMAMSLFMETYVSHLCGCQPCKFMPKTYALKDAATEGPTPDPELVYEELIKIFEIQTEDPKVAETEALHKYIALLFMLAEDPTDPTIKEEDIRALTIDQATDLRDRVLEVYGEENSVEEKEIGGEPNDDLQ